MQRRRKGWVVLLVALLVSLCSVEAWAQEAALNLESPSAILMDGATGQVLFEKNSNEQRPPASVTKIMTLLLIYEAVDDGKLAWDELVTVSDHASSMGGSQVYLEPQEQQTVQDLVKCISIASANDASVAMAERIGGSEEGFVAMMNEKAKELGMNDTNFVNACGLEAEGHVTTAHDIALMSRELITKYPDISTYATTWMDEITHTTRKGTSTFGLTNTNKLVKWYPDATGLKTGFTSDAMFCLSATATRDGRSQIAVIMGAPDSNTRFKEAMALLDYGFANYMLLEGEDEEISCGQVAVEKGEVPEVDAKLAEKFQYLAEKGSDNLTWEYHCLETVPAPVAAGDVVGEAVYFYGGQEVGTVPLVAAETVNRSNFTQTLEKMSTLWVQ